MAQFVGEYLCIHRPELAHDEIDMQADLKQSILCKSTTRLDDTVKRRVGICSKTAKKWLNRLGYKWRDV